MREASKEVAIPKLTNAFGGFCSRFATGWPEDKPDPIILS
jgi:hypothetical protein